MVGFKLVFSCRYRVSTKIRYLTTSLKVLLPLAPLSLTIGYILLVINPVPLSDEWHWMEALLIPYQQGDISFWQYITGEYSFLSHSHYFTLLFILIDYTWFGLDFSHMAYTGLVAYVMTWLMLVWYYLSLHSYQLKKTQCTCLLILTLAYASPLPDFPWVLVLFEYVYYFFALGLLCLFDLSIRQKLRFEIFLIAFCFTVIFTETIGLISVLSILGWSLLACLTKNYSWTYSGVLWLSFLILLALQYALLGHGIGGRSNLSDSALAIIQQPASVLESVIITFSQPLTDRTMLSESSTFQNNFRLWHVGVGVIGLTLSLICLSIYIAGAGHKKSQLPLLLFLFGLLSWATILLARYLDVGHYIFDARRFTRLFTVYYISAGIALSLSSHHLSRPMAITTLSVLLMFFAYASIEQYQRAEHVQNYFFNAEKEITSTPANQENLEKSIPRCKSEECIDTIDFLRKNNLSVFR